MRAPEYADLIAGLHDGDERSIKILFSMHYRPLCYFAERLVRVKAEAEDIAVESFLKLLRKKADFNNLLDVKSFLFTVVRNACIDYLRKEKTRLRNISHVCEPSIFGETPGSTEMITAQLLQTIYEEIENLPKQCRKIFKSYYVEGKSTAAISTEMGIRPQTVLNQKAKALRLLQLKFLKQGLLSSHCLLLATCIF